MLNYQQTETFIIEDVDHVYHVLGIKIEHAMFLLLTLVMPAALGFRILYALLIMALEIVVFRKLTEAEILGRPYQYDPKLLSQWQKWKMVSRLIKIQLSLPKEFYRGDF